MYINYRAEGEEKKRLIQSVADITGREVKYLGAPSMAYEIGAFTVTKDGALEFDETDFPEGIDQILQDLERSGIEAEVAESKETEEPDEEAGESAEEDGEDILTIQMPRTSLTDEAIDNIEKIIESKGELMKHAFGVSDLPLEVDDERVSFRWFRLLDAESTQTYTKFVTAICDMAKNQKRITAKPKENENEKYAFRCFLLRLGFIGAEFKEDRRILLKNLGGSAAFPTKAAADDFAAKQKAKRDAEKTAEQEVAE